ncbi:uncharacterized protein [Amphiura filiformis]|uniref:uncharacterized protein n=1 Tax=Amphiura filiformis TaxID=82378 RepID=UPI003B22254E
MSKRHFPEVYEPSAGKRPRPLITEKHDRPSPERSYTPPNKQCQNECSAECCTKEWRKPLVIPEVACLGVQKRGDYSPPLSKSDYDEEITRAKQHLHYHHHQQQQQRSVSSTAPLTVPVPRPPSQPNMEPPKKGHTLVHMDSRIESSKTPTSRVPPHGGSRDTEDEDSTRYSQHDHHTVSSSPDRTWVQRWPKSAKWLELNHLCRAITSGHSKTYHSLSKHIANILQSTREKAKTSTHAAKTNPLLTKDQILERLSKHMTEQWGRIAQFAESIPGFCNFSKEDQGILLQIGGLEVILLQLAQMYDRQTHLIQMWDGQWISFEETLKLSKSSEVTDFNLAVFFELLFGLAESLSTMHLRDEDLAIFSALLLLASDHQGLRHKMQVEELQEKVLNCFAYILAQNHVQEPGLLAQVLMCMPTLRTISTSYLELTSTSSPTQQWGSWPLEL